MPNLRTPNFFLAASLLAGASSCIPMKPPAQNAGPALSGSGVEVAVLRQSCSQTSEPDWYGLDLVEARLEVQVQNGATAPATVHPDQFRLLASDGAALRTITCDAADPLTVSREASQTFELRFMTRGGLECAKAMRLDPRAGVTLGGSPVSFQRVSFAPHREL